MSLIKDINFGRETSDDPMIDNILDKRMSLSDDIDKAGFMSADSAVIDAGLVKKAVKEIEEYVKLVGNDYYDYRDLLFKIKEIFGKDLT